MSEQSRMLKCKFWDDKFIEMLDPSEKLLYLYLLTNPLTNLAGVYEISIRRIAYDTGFEKDTVQKMLDRFEQAKKVFYFNEYSFIVIPNFPKHQVLSNPKICKGIESYLKKTPQKILSAIHSLSIPYAYPIDKISHLILFNLSQSNLIKSNSSQGEKQAEQKLEDSPSPQKTKQTKPEVLKTPQQQTKPTPEKIPPQKNTEPDPVIPDFPKFKGLTESLLKQLFTEFIHKYHTTEIFFKVMQEIHNKTKKTDEYPLKYYRVCLRNYEGSKDLSPEMRKQGQQQAKAITKKLAATG
jgi:hypothetical protein